jgi:hypothetical protein
MKQTLVAIVVLAFWVASIFAVEKTAWRFASNLKSSKEQCWWAYMSMSFLGLAAVFTASFFVLQAIR